MKISKIIQRQIPAFIREMPALAGEKYNKFIAFLVRYYEFLETSFNKIGTTEGAKLESSPTVIEPPVGIPGAPGVPLKDGDYLLVTTPGFFRVGAPGKKKTVYASVGKIIVFTKDGSSYVRSGEFFNFLTDKDISSNSPLNIILNALINEVAYNLPKSFTEEQLVLQRIKELYTTKGSEEAYRFLFRVMFNKEIDFYYPSTSVLRTSDGVWNQNFSIFVRCIVGNPFMMKDNGADVLARKNKVALSVIEVEERTLLSQLFGSLDLGFIRESIETVIDLGYTTEEAERIFEIGYVNSVYINGVFEVSIDRDFYGTFSDNDVIVCRNDEGEVFIGYIVSTTTKAKVYSKGKGFRIGDLIPVTIRDSDNVIKSTGTILKVSDISAGGAIETVDFLKFGYEYSRPIVISATSEGEVKVVIEERAENEEDPDFNTNMTFDEMTGGFISRGNSYVDMDYSLDENCVINYVINSGGVYNNTSVNVSIEPAPAGGINAQATPILNQFKNGAGETKFELVGLNITNRGSGYLTPPQITVSGSGEVADVDSLIGYDLYWDLEYCGEIKSRFIYNRTRRIPSSSQDKEEKDDKALIRLYPGAVAKYPGYFQDNRGFLSDAIYLQDGRYYQDFSYVIKSDVPMNSYDSYVRTMLHPSGTMMFGEYQISSDISLENVVDVASTYDRYLTINLQDDVISSETYNMTDSVEYSYLHTVMDFASATDYGYVINDPYTLPYLPYASRMWEEYTIGDDFVEFGGDVTPPPGPAVTLDPSYSNALGVLSNGNLSWEWTWVGSYGCSYSTLPRSTGKYYFEIINNVEGGYGGAIYDNWSFNGGISTDRGIGNDTLIGSSATAWGFSNSNSSGLTTDTTLFNNSTPIELIGVSQIPEGGYLGVAVDFDAGKIWFNANGTWVLDGNPASGTNPAFTFASNIVAYAGVGQGSRNPFGKSTINFGATSFVGIIPAGFTAWNN